MISFIPYALFGSGNPVKVTGPTIAAGPVTGTITACIGTASASPNIQQFLVTGSNLSADITATAPLGFEISVSAASGYGSSVTLTQSGGNVTDSVYVRSAVTASGNISGNVVLATAGATSQNVVVAGTITPLPTVSSVNNRSLASGTATTAINFTGTASAYVWTNDTPIIGLAANGSGNISSFTAVNAGNTPVTATITVSPLTSGTGCSGIPVTFTITVTPAAPHISYNGPLTFATGTAVTPVKPANTGGAVPATTYAQVTTFAGTAGITGKTNGTGAAASFSYPTSVGTDILGNVYVNDGFNNLIRKITPSGVVTTFAGSGGFGADNGPGASATFSNLGGLTVDRTGNVYVSEASNNDIRKITPASVVSTLAGQTNNAGAANGQGTSAKFSSPAGMGTDPAGNIYVADAGNYLIRKITPAGLVSTLAGQTGTAGQANGPDSIATFIPQAVAADGQGNVYVADGNNLVRKISNAGIVSTLAGSGAVGSADGTGTSASFYQPDAIIVDACGNLYVGDAGNTIRKITPAGVVTTFAGQAGVSGAADGVGNAATFNGPAGLAIDLSGNLYVGDIINSTIRKVVTTGYAIDKPLPAGLIFDSKTGNISGTPTIGSPATNYTITAYNTGGSSSAVVSITITSTLNFAAISPKVYGTADFNPAVSTAGAITYTSSNPAVATIVAGNIHIKSIGVSTITATNGSVTIMQPLTVTPAQLTLIADNKSRVVNTANPVLTITYNGFVNGDGTAKFTTQPSIVTTATSLSAPGNYPITITEAADSNYTIKYVAGTLTVLGGNITTPAPVISYAGQQNYFAGTEISPFVAINTGGTVPSNPYARVTTIAGVAGIKGSTNGAAGSATFNQPYGIAIDPSGNIYVAEQVGNLIRKITPAGVVSTFAGSGSATTANGTGIAASFDFPSGLTIDSAGNFFVSDQATSMIRKITPQAIVSTYAGGGSPPYQNGQGYLAGFNGPLGIASDKTGDLYVADSYNALIRKIAPGANVSTFAGVAGNQGTTDGSGTAARFTQPAGIATDASGNVYVSDANRIRKITPGGLVSTLAGSGTFASVNGAGIAASFGSPTGLVLDPLGNVYVTDQAFNCIRKVTPDGVVTTIAGSSTTFGSADGIGTLATLNFPAGLTIDSSGNLYLVDEGNELIRKITTTGYAIDKPLPPGLYFDGSTGTISGTPTAASPAANYTITAYNISGVSTAIINIQVGAPLFPAPVISYTGSQSYTVNTAISPLSPTNTGGAVPAMVYSQVTTQAGSGAAGAVNATGPAASFKSPYGTATDGAGNIYVADAGNNLIRKISSGGVVTTFAGSGAYGSANGTATAASFSSPRGVSVDGAGNVYVADQGSNKIRMITPAGVVSTLAGSGTAGSTNATGAAASFNSPFGVTVDNTGKVYVADYGNNLVREIAPGGVVTTLAGSGATGAVNATGTSASFHGPRNVTTDGAGNVYVADQGNNLIRKISPGGVVTTFAGSGAAGHANGTGTAASFSAPSGVACDPSGNIYVSDAGSNQIRLITPGGVVTTLAGSGAAGAVNATGTAASFNSPYGPSVDGAGNLYVAELNNQQIRKVSLAGYTISPALPAGLTFDSSTGTIGGTPTATNPSTNYTITAYNSGGNGNTILNIRVASPPVISYTGSQSYTVNTAISPLSPTNTGGAVPAMVYSQVTTQAG
ncbi:MAG: NHL domain-containing protein, partial [Mucilaginibacter sp.]